MKFATVGYSRNVETKYHDKAIGTLTKNMSKTGSVTPGAPETTQAAAMGAFAESDRWFITSMNTESSNPGSPGSLYASDLMKGIGTGTTVTGRIGNKIRVKWMKIRYTVTAPYVNNTKSDADNAQYGESALNAKSVEADGTLSQFVRATVRVMIVKDTQVNSTDEVIKWDDVMESCNGFGPDTGCTNGVHSELRISNMGRFQVLSDRTMELDADDPQKTKVVMLRGIGQVRYNGPGVNALTDQGIYVIWAVYCGGVLMTTLNPDYFKMAPVVVSRRIAFTDC